MYYLSVLLIVTGVREALSSLPTLLSPVVLR